MVITQNALADSSYVDYLRFQYGSDLAGIAPDDVKKGFDDYLADASKRYLHDQEFPDEPRQMRPGESIRMVNGKAEASGQVAVMAINELIFQGLMQKNPQLSFAVEESFPFRSTYADAKPAGIVMELGRPGDGAGFSSELATESVGYWRNVSTELSKELDMEGAEYARKTYSHDASSQANLLAAHNYFAEAEETYRLAIQMWPDNPESVYGLADLMSRTGRREEGLRLADEFARNHGGH
jgi:hypothetical protein